MTLHDALTAAGMTPPHHIVEGKWVRFPGCGKGKSNRAGWCKLITPTMAVYGDWSTGLTETWIDENHPADAESARQMKEAATHRARRFAAEERNRQRKVADLASQAINSATMATHPYLARKGFPEALGLVGDGKLLVPVRDCHDYKRIISIQQIDADGSKKFLPGGRTRGGIYRIGAPIERAKRIILCEGYATGLSLDVAMKRLTGPHAIVVCFSARNLEVVAELFPTAFVAADHDESKAGEQAAIRTGLRWTMPATTAMDFNDLHMQCGILAVTQALREMFLGGSQK